MGDRVPGTPLWEHPRLEPQRPLGSRRHSIGAFHLVGVAQPAWWGWGSTRGGAPGSGHFSGRVLLLRGHGSQNMKTLRSPAGNTLILFKNRVQHFFDPLTWNTSFIECRFSLELYIEQLFLC